MKFVAHERFQYVLLKKFGKNPLKVDSNENWGGQKYGNGWLLVWDCGDR